MCTSYRFPLVVLHITVSCCTNPAIKLSLHHISQVAYQYPATNQSGCSYEHKCIFPQWTHIKPQSRCFSRWHSALSINSHVVLWFFLMTFSCSREILLLIVKSKSRRRILESASKIGTSSAQTSGIWLSVNLKLGKWLPVVPGTFWVRALGFHTTVCTRSLSMVFLPQDFSEFRTKSLVFQRATQFWVNGRSCHFGTVSRFWEKDLVWKFRNINKLKIY